MIKKITTNATCRSNDNTIRALFILIKECILKINEIVEVVNKMEKNSHCQNR